MEFHSKEDIEAPQSDVFAMISDFEAIERSVLRRGVKVRRTDRMPKPQAGMHWTATFKFRGKSRDAEIDLVEYEPNTSIQFQSMSGGLEVQFDVELVALSRSRTRMNVDVKMNPKTLSSRLLVQSLKLARANLTKRFKVKVANFAKDMEDRHNRIA